MTSWSKHRFGIARLEHALLRTILSAEDKLSSPVLRRPDERSRRVKINLRIPTNGLLFRNRGRFTIIQTLYEQQWMI